MAGPQSPLGEGRQLEEKKHITGIIRSPCVKGEWGGHIGLRHDPCWPLSYIRKDRVNRDHSLSLACALTRSPLEGGWCVAAACKGRAVLNPCLLCPYSSSAHHNVGRVEWSPGVRQEIEEELHTGVCVSRHGHFLTKKCLLLSWAALNAQPGELHHLITMLPHWVFSQGEDWILPTKPHKPY